MTDMQANHAWERGLFRFATDNKLDATAADTANRFKATSAGAELWRHMQGVTKMSERESATAEWDSAVAALMKSEGIGKAAAAIRLSYSDEGRRIFAKGEDAQRRAVKTHGVMKELAAGHVNEALEKFDKADRSKAALALAAIPIGKELHAIAGGAFDPDSGMKR